MRLFSKIGVGLIRIYQWCIAPFIGDVCRFTPSCSHYGIEAIEKHGLLWGCWLTVKRIIRCNPWGGSFGHDPVPSNAKTTGENKINAKAQRREERYKVSKRHDSETL